MRRRVVASVVLVASARTLTGWAGGPLAGASSETKHAPPVNIPGRVTKKGTKTAKGNAITIEAHNFYFRPTHLPHLHHRRRDRRPDPQARREDHRPGGRPRHGWRHRRLLSLPRAQRQPRRRGHTRRALFTQAGGTVTPAPSRLTSSPTTPPTTTTSTGSRSGGGYGY